MIVILDSGPVGYVTNPNANDISRSCNAWLESVLKAGHVVVLPEIVDYEIRRELIRGNKIEGLNRLDKLGQTLAFESISSKVMRLAAQFGAEARKRGAPAADDKAHNCDMILAAQAQGLAQERNQPTIVATTNVRHLQMFVDAREWQQVDPSRG